jgi:UDP-N-acetyl-D-mannosaminuronic acid dehydrogenase
MANIHIMGLGYVGLTLAIACAKRGMKVIGYEVNPEIFTRLRDQHKAHFFEPGLDHLIQECIKKGSFVVAERLTPSKSPETYIITVGTPLGTEGKTQLEAISSVSDEIASNCAAGSTIIARSTMKIGTTKSVIKPIFERHRKTVHLAVCPERTVEGSALEELHEIPQIIGSPDPQAQYNCQKLFSEISPASSIVNSWEGAEAIKLMDNTFRDIQFGIANEFSLLVEKIGGDAKRLFEIANSGYKRTNLAKPGLVGGPCLEKDPHILLESARDLGVDLPMTRSARFINENMLGHGIEKMKTYFLSYGKPIRKIAVLGMAFKGNPETSDMRGSLAQPLVKELSRWAPKAKIFAYDLHVAESDVSRLECTLSQDLLEVVNGAELCIFQHDAKYLKGLDLNFISSVMARSGLVYDYWTLFNKEILELSNDVSYLNYGGGN